MLVPLLTFAAFVICIWFLVYLVRDSSAPTRREAKAKRMELQWQRDVVKLLEGLRRRDDDLPFMTEAEKAEADRILGIFYRS